MTEKNTFSNEKFIHILFMGAVFSFVFVLFLLSISFWDKEILLIISGILILGIIWLLSLKVVSIRISNQRVEISHQRLLCQLIGLKVKKVIIHNSYLHEFEIMYSLPISLIVLFLQKNGDYCYKRIPLFFFSKKSIETIEIEIIRQLKWGLGV